jgi:hypothetical protein
LQTLYLSSNPLNPELAAAYEQGLDAVKAYLRAKATAQITLNEAKLILVGEGEVGKSCLLGALREKVRTARLTDPQQVKDALHDLLWVRNALEAALRVKLLMSEAF